MLLIDDLLLAPLWGVIRLAELIHGQVMQELDDEDGLRRRLVQLRLQYELDEVDEATYLAREAELLARLRQLRLAALAEWEGEPDAEPGG